jgi:hypothetical protein
MSVIPVTWKVVQEDLKFKASLGKVIKTLSQKYKQELGTGGSHL